MKFFNTHKNDMILIIALLIAAGGILTYSSLSRRIGGEAVVTVDGTVVVTLPLSENSSFSVLPETGFDAASDFCNTIEVSDGRVRVIEANCPDKICEKTGWIRYDGEMIVCLPHKLIVTVTGGTTGNDAMAR